MAARTRTLRHWKRWIICADSHGCEIDASASAAFLDFVNYWKPSIRIHGGDAFDFAWLRRGASENEVILARVEDDFKRGIEFLATYKPTVILWGNHDWRLFKRLDDAYPEQRFYAGQMVDQIAAAIGNAETRRYTKTLGVYQLGTQKILHGFGSGAYSGYKLANIYGDCMYGHFHRVEDMPVPRHDPGSKRHLQRARCIGCLCNLEMPYNETSPGTMTNEHGWAYGLLSPSGEVVAWQAQTADGMWILPTEVNGYAQDT